MMNADELRDVLKHRDEIKMNPFSVLKEIARFCNHDPSGAFAREFVIRALDNREIFDGSVPGILDALVEQVGLFPYIETENLGVRGRLLYEAHRPVDASSQELDIVFHEMQAKYYQILMDGNSLILSAPTSFGKSLLVDAIVASLKFNNIVIVVPTIALIDETRRRLSRFSRDYKLITHNDQESLDKNIYILTQERVIERVDLLDIDLTVIDEFYKLAPSISEDGSRSSALNHALYNLSKASRQIYLLGPNIKEVSSGFADKYKCVFVETSYNTVITEVEKIRIVDSREKSFVERCKNIIDEPTMVYCKSPEQANEVVRLLMTCNHETVTERVIEASEWIGDVYHPDWVLCKALRRRIGIHHGKMPRSLSQLMVYLFNNGEISYLVCTSTLIEGVNTKAKNVIIFDGKLAGKKIDYFTFMNIRGRSGRMFRYFIGKLIILDNEPEQKHELIDIPFHSQNSDVSLGLLVQMDQEDLTRESLGRVQELYNNSVLSMDTIRKNKHVDPYSQIRLAQHLTKCASSEHRSLAWIGLPTWNQLVWICETIFEYFNLKTTKSVASAKQLAFRLMQLSQNNQTSSLILKTLEKAEGREPVDTSDAVEIVIDFQRTWASFRMPRYLGAVDSIQKEIFLKRNLPPGDYSFYISCVENLFLAPELIALEEYGLPVEIGKKIGNKLVLDRGVDSALKSLKLVRSSDVPLSNFERMILELCQRDL
ncbi:MAG: DEAD/DEAH box helicase [Magnetococcales bacterium]|nr:DEAD/DEAH box helicase [Magnetococcales bacterium]